MAAADIHLSGLPWPRPPKGLRRGAVAHLIDKQANWVVNGLGK